MISHPRLVSNPESYMSSLPQPETFDAPAWTNHYHVATEPLLVTHVQVNG